MNREELIDVITKEIEKLNTLPNIKEENFNIGYKKAIYDSCYLYENMNQEIERLNNIINETKKILLLNFDTTTTIFNALNKLGEVDK